MWETRRRQRILISQPTGLDDWDPMRDPTDRGERP
jgi:hypothetical protein